MKYGLFIIWMIILIQVCTSCKTANQKSNNQAIQQSPTIDSGQDETATNPKLNDLRGLLLPY